MAIHKKFIHFKTFANFNSQKLSANEQDTQYTLGINGEIQNGSPTILYNSICYIKDTKQQWTHGQLYDCGGTSNTKEPFYFEVSDIDELTMTCRDFTNLINAFKDERPIFLRFDSTQVLDERYIVPVSIVYNEINLTLSFIYHDTIYKINYEVNEGGNMYCSTDQTVTMIPIDRIYTKPNGGIPKSDLSSDVQTILNNTLTSDDIYDDGFIMANGIVDVEDHYYHLPNDLSQNPDFTLATKSDVNSRVPMSMTGDLTCADIQSLYGGGATYALPDSANGDEDDILLSSNTVKTINGESIIGSGDITISGSSSTTPMRYITPAANIPIPMNTAKVITSVTSTNQTFTLATNAVITNPASITQEQKWEIVFAINNSLSTAPTITFNTGNVGTIYWINGEAPTFEVGKFYEVSFLNVGGILLGVCAEFSPAS